MTDKNYRRRWNIYWNSLLVRILYKLCGHDPTHHNDEFHSDYVTVSIRTCVNIEISLQFGDVYDII